MFARMDGHLPNSGAGAAAPPEPSAMPTSTSASRLVSRTSQGGGDADVATTDDDNKALFVYGTLMNEKVGIFCVYHT